MSNSTLLRSVLLAVCAALLPVGFAAPVALPALLPVPTELQAGSGRLPVTAAFSVAVRGHDDARLRGAVDRALARTAERTGLTLAHPSAPAATATLVIECAGPGLAIPALDEDESYALTVTSTQAVLRAPTVVGALRGLETLLQLLATDSASPSAWFLPAVTIRDRPRFAWRGAMLDSGRHFFPTATVKRFLDLMARYKLNSFHWHLTEDQGWRIEIKRYPRLTEFASRRTESPLPGDRKHGDGKPYGGFYTQADIREIVAYATARGIAVVPEIELPGHSAAAIAAYPELGNDDIPDFAPAVATHWGIFYYTYAPKEETFQFLTNVLAEVCDLFPGKFVHIGGDEAPKVQWEKSPRAQAFMREHNLKDGHELQSHFIRRIEGVLASRGRRLVGWDEIQEGGLSPTATMMVWRDWKWARLALERGNDIVMSPNTHCYFDYYQSADRAAEPEAIGNFLPLRKVYDFDPVPPGTPPEQLRHILGGQGNLWSEYIADQAKLDYMAFPRLCALADVLWSPAAAHDWPDFTRRLGVQLTDLDRLKVNYRKPLAPELVP